ncbi:dTDP-glucose 4,6-dehydratase [Thermodesulfobium narugense DSM 14796]|uniref:dTDP-glucose 4,6-dehydratase n=1 Tax=Thermodesulfobium narugense DSM 14796 TaxID=747365 RepID=M1E8D3_9BACT|nr:dTDP-glucose 4,6-dehydratase [Thermodesulfobium narugense]AEE14409.1 dTDP-glucose 4,6-dehydratase [Thermodesulfobium narugense DSM 14796]
MNILITGGAGFIGSEFVRQSVEKGYKVSVIDKLTYAGSMDRINSVIEEIRFYKDDIKNEDSIKKIIKTDKIEAVINFAAETHVDRSILEPNEFINTNICGTTSILNSLANSDVLLVHVSTDEVYGELGKDGKFSEDSPLRPNSPYSASKASADLLINAYARTYSLRTRIVRPSNNYGMWQFPEKLIPVVIYKALNNQRVPVYADGSNIREWTYVKDCCSAIFKVLNDGKDSNVYNIGSGEEMTNLNLVKKILSILGKSDDLIEFVKDRPGHDFRYSLNTEKISKELGWKPSFSLDQGLKETVQWYVENYAWLEKEVANLKEYWNKVYRSKS